MLVLPTAKILLFIALNLGPQNPSVVYATSQSESYVWTATPTGWDLEAKAFPSSDFTRNPDQLQSFNGSPSASSLPENIRTVAHHHWKDNYAMVFDNGDRIEKSGDHAFYIVNAGGSNEKIFTILYPVASK